MEPGIDYDEIETFVVPKNTTYIVRAEMDHYDEDPEDEVGASCIVAVTMQPQRNDKYCRRRERLDTGAGDDVVDSPHRAPSGSAVGRDGCVDQGRATWASQ
ncbi:hypothetical protein [Paraburkholderia ferrariae]|uniref:Uncharacterized protein n=1 Tax=Paraburkholderia ferrariae TaxID=386056 RepID=A0ABU9S4P0_9BURK